MEGIPLHPENFDISPEIAFSCIIHRLSVNVVLIIPLSTASVERSFSQMKLIKLRNRLRVPHTAAMSTGTLNCRLSQYPYGPVVHPPLHTSFIHLLTF